MCLAVVIRPQGKPSKAEMETAFHQNPHGAGFAYISPLTGEITVYRTMNQSFRKLWRALNRARSEAPLSQFLLHFRFATHGKKDEQNCHPFLTESKRMAVIHNGVMSNWAAWASKDESDTAVFVRKALSPLEDVLDNKEVADFLESSTLGSKVAMLTKDNRVLFFHENAGTWIKDVWYSNLHHAYAAAAGHMGYYTGRERWKSRHWRGHMDNRPIVGERFIQTGNGQVNKITPATSMFGPVGQEMGSVSGARFDYCPTRLLPPSDKNELTLFSKKEMGDDLDDEQIFQRDQEWDMDLSVVETDRMFGDDLCDFPSLGGQCWYCGERTISKVRLDGALACDDCQLEFALASQCKGSGTCGI